MDKVHFWTSQKERIKDTLAFESTEYGWAKYSYCVSDTAQVGFKIGKVSWIDHCQFLNNPYYNTSYNGTPTAIYLGDNLDNIFITYNGFEGRNSQGLNIVNDLSKFKGVYEGNIEWNSCFNIPSVITENKIYSFTPSIKGLTSSGNPTYIVQNGKYTKVGKIITFSTVLKVTFDNTIDGNLVIEGLPYQPAIQTSISIGYRSNIPDLNINLHGTLYQNYINLYRIYDNDTSASNDASSSPVNGSAFRGKTCEFHISGTYLIN